MKTRKTWLLLSVLGLLVATSFQLQAREKDHKSTNEEIAIVNFKLCIEGSELGRDQQQKLESMRHEMVSTLEKNENELNQIGSQLKDSEYMDSMSQDSEEELKHRYRMLSEQLARSQNQFYQAYQQAHFKVLQTMQGAVSRAAEGVAKKKNISFVVNEEVCFFFKNTSDITEYVIEEMDLNFDFESQAIGMQGES